MNIKKAVPGQGTAENIKTTLSKALCTGDIFVLRQGKNAIYGV